MIFNLYRSKSRGVENNAFYPIAALVTSAETLIEAVKYDHVCAEYKNNHRANDDFIKSNVIPMDCDNDHSDNPEEWITPESLRNELCGINYALVFSRNNMKDKEGKGPRPRFHVYFEIEFCDDGVYYSALKTAIRAKFPFFDDNALDAARFFFGVEKPEVIWNDEGWCNIDEIVSDDVVLPTATGAKSSDFENFESARVGYMIPEGKRNSTLLSYALKVLKKFGLGDDSAYTLFINESNRCVVPLEMKELESIWNNAKKFYENTISKAEDYVSPEEYKKKHAPGFLKPEDYSDIGQAKVLTQEYRDELRYTEGTDYIRYDGEVWNESKQQSVAAAEQFLDLQLKDADNVIEKALVRLERLGVDRALIVKGDKNVIGALTPEQSKAYAAYLSALVYHKFVMGRRNMKYITSALMAAKPMLEMKQSDLDKNEFLLNTPGMTYDLREGMKGGREPCSEDFITKQTAVAPSDEGAELWEDALELFFCGDRELISYVQEIVGLGAIGKVYVEAMIISYGEGSNGKSTFWNTIQRVLGTYSGGMSADALTVGCKRNVKPEMAELKGKRLIIAAELEEGMRLNTSVIKQLCSTDEIQGEKKYKDPFQFSPSHTLVLYTNHLPRIGANDLGTWRRLIVIPFNAKIKGSGDIKNYSDYLFKNAGPAILKWIIEGSEKVIKHDYHLEYPKCVKEAIDAYKEDNDWLGDFIEECCDIDPSFEQKSGDLYAQYRLYCVAGKGYIRSTTDFYSALEIAGFKRKKTNKGSFVYGLKLKENFLN